MQVTLDVSKCTFELYCSDSVHCVYQIRFNHGLFHEISLSPFFPPEEPSLWSQPPPVPTLPHFPIWWTTTAFENHHCDLSQFTLYRLPTAFPPLSPRYGPQSPPLPRLMSHHCDITCSSPSLHPVPTPTSFPSIEPQLWSQLTPLTTLLPLSPPCRWTSPTVTINVPVVYMVRYKVVLRGDYP